MKPGFYCVVLVVILAACSSPAYKHPHVLIKTEAGDIEVELYTDKAPKTAGGFLSNVEAGYYKHSNFYRVLTDYNQPSDAPKANLIQGGIWKTNYKTATSLPGIPHESTDKTGILHKDGIISMARSDPGTATTEFFICLGNQPGFDFGGDNNPDKLGYAAFGKAVRGMHIVDHIYNRRAMGEAFDPPVVIIDIVRL